MERINLIREGLKGKVVFLMRGNDDIIAITVRDGVNNNGVGVTWKEFVTRDH